jgi:hypothetical protein
LLFPRYDSGIHHMNTTGEMYGVTT